MSAEPLPPPLKIPEVSRFINRANQLRTIKPAIAYWCEYHAVNQIVTKSLHTTDDDCFAYTKGLIERLEATKTERADDEAIVDNTAGQAYVEQFAQETFSRAERTLRANKVSRQTADTFDAAATFFDLTHEWGTPEPEIIKKIKFAKWNAARILKAIREGKDPNETNPQVQEDEGSEPVLSPTDPAVQQIMSPPVASVEDAPDDGEPPIAPVQEGYFPPTTAQPEPFVPSPLTQSPGPPASVMHPPPAQVSPAPSPDVHPPQQSPQIPTKLPPPEPSAPTPSAWNNVPSAPPPSAPTPQYVPPTVAPAPAPVRQAGPPAPSAPTGFAPNHKSIEQAQKHAKWAISALNFEDVPTAVQELRNALGMLGAQ
ncbi:Vacuolar protein sorting-associated protein vts1 [Metarhizium brunneum]|uniref:Vacuolar protein sorting-associated protein vts1 n=1 Tax=Metarhizium brunneum TaxID=500148 RepID=A0A7D5UTC8_9HYPO